MSQHAPAIQYRPALIEASLAQTRARPPNPNRYRASP
jgi:hypothetical protein